MTDINICASCEYINFDVEKIVKTKELLKPIWLQKIDYVKNFIDSHDFKLSKPSEFYRKNLSETLTINLKLKKFANKKILYWASNSKKKGVLISDAKQAYNKFENSGVAKVNSEGEVVLYLNCPQVYRSDGRTYFKHIHFVVETKPKVWNNKHIFTKLVFCKYSLQKIMELKNEGKTVIINALPSSYYAKDHIPKSYNLYHEDVKNMNFYDLTRWMKDVVKLHYPKLFKHVKSGKIKIYELPIVVYCAHSKCTASEMTIKELLRKGFVNVSEYSGGMKEYREKYKHD